MSGCIKIALLELAGKAADAFVSRLANAADHRHADLRTHAEARRRSLAGRALLRALLEDGQSFSRTQWTIEADESGKPHATAPDGSNGPPVSISHSHQLVAACVGRDGRIGIDVEVHVPRRPVLAIARSAFGPREIVAVEQDRQSFYRIWTLKEAMAKATGAGLSRVADKTDRVAQVCGIGTWTIPDRAGVDWRLAYLAPTPDISLAVALHGPVAPAERDWSMDCLDIENYPAGMPKPAW